ncbi:MAG: cellulose synthase subunit BcsC-related outer membrane protein [Pseudomonadota bacterium]
MKHLLTLSPLILLHAVPVQAEVERTPISSNLDLITPLERPAVTRMIEPHMQEQPIAPALIEQKKTDATRIHGEPLGTEESVKPTPATATKAKAAEVTRPSSPPPSTTTKPRVITPTPKASAPSPQPTGKPTTAASSAAGLAGTAPAKTASTPEGASLTESQAHGDDRLKYDQAVSAIFAASEQGRHEDALRMMKEMWGEIVRLEDFGTMAAMAYTAMRLNDEKTAIMAARKAAELVDDDQFYEVLANVLNHFKRFEEMQAVLKKMDPKSPVRKRGLANYAINKATVAFDQGNYSEAEQALLEQHAALDEGGLELLGWTQYRLGKLEDAAQQFSAAYAKKPASSSAQGLAFSLHRLKRYEELLEKASVRPGPLAELLSPEVKEAIKAGGKRFSIGPDGRLAVAASPSSEDEKPGITARVDPKFRDKRGVPGEGVFHQRGMLTSLAWQGEKDRAVLDVEHQKADDEEQEFTGQRYYLSWTHRFEEDGYVFRMGAGRSYSGGVVEPTWLGHIGLARYTPDWGLEARLFRRSNEETMLSLVGTLDPLRRPWGRVVETGLALSGSRRLGDWNAIASFTAASLTGENVADNKKYELYSRALRPITSIPGLSLGPELILSHYQRNLSAFEFGHGGYFSPDRYVQIGAVAQYETRLDKLELNLQAGIGHNWNWQDAAPGNPLTSEEPGKYPASSGKGVVYSALVDGALPLSPQWRIGFTLGTQKSASYSDQRMGLYAKGFYD